MLRHRLLLLLLTNRKLILVVIYDLLCRCSDVEQCCVETLNLLRLATERPCGLTSLVALKWLSQYPWNLVLLRLYSLRLQLLVFVRCLVIIVSVLLPS